MCYEILREESRQTDLFGARIGLRYQTLARVWNRSPTLNRFLRVCQSLLKMPSQWY